MCYVYRIQHSISGDGPYVAHNDPNVITDNLRESLAYTQTDRAHPGMWYDCDYMLTPENRLCSEYYCGFKTIEQMITWFMCAFDTLEEHGYIVAIYDCADTNIIAGKYQIAFLKDESLLVDTVSITDMLRMA